MRHTNLWFKVIDITEDKIIGIKFSGEAKSLEELKHSLEPAYIWEVTDYEVGKFYHYAAVILDKTRVTRRLHLLEPTSELEQVVKDFEDSIELNEVQPTHNIYSGAFIKLMYTEKESKR